MAQYWREFLRYYAVQSNRGQIRPGQGVEAAWVHSLLVINNGTYLTSPVADAADLRARCREAIADAQPHGLPWGFFIYDPLIPDSLLPEADEIIAGEGLSRIGGLRVMSCDELLAPLRPLPDLELRRAVGGKEAADMLDLNTLAHGMPAGITESVMETNCYFGSPEREIGFVGYVDGEPASTASVLVMGDCLYVEAVATDPRFQRKGFGETVMRHALAAASLATGIGRSALDASDMGAPLYAQMGYRRLEAWRFYMMSG